MHCSIYELQIMKTDLDRHLVRMRRLRISRAFSARGTVTVGEFVEAIIVEILQP